MIKLNDLIGQNYEVTNVELIPTAFDKPTYRIYIENHDNPSDSVVSEHVLSIVIEVSEEILKDLDLRGYELDDLV